MLRIPKIVNSCEDTFVCWGRMEYAKFATDTDEVVFKLLNTDFDVQINGVAAEVRECRVSAMPFNRPWPGKQRPLDQTESAGFISFSADEEVEIRVKRKQSFEHAFIKPLSKNVEVAVADGEAVFKLKEHGQYVLEFGNEHNALHIFFNQWKEYPDAEKATVYFGPGMHFPGVVTLRDNDTVFIDENAVVFGSINSLGAKNVKIYGGGVVDNSCEERLTENAYENFHKGAFKIYNCENIDVSDIILTNSCTWTMAMFNCKNIHIDNVKIVGQWRYNTDGIDVVNSENVLIENCFIRSFDDTISLKAVYDYPEPMQNITIDNCVMWCGWGKNCEIGVETACKEYKNIVFRNCDLIHNSGGAMCVSNGCYADMHDILFENINVDLEKNTLPQIIQTADSQKYDAKGVTAPACLIQSVISPFAIRTQNTSGIIRASSDIPGCIHDITYKNIHIYTDSEDIKPKIVITTNNSDKKLKNFQLENIFMNGEKVEDFDRFETVFLNAENITIA